MSEYFLGNYDLAPDQETLVAIVQAAGKVLEERGAEGLENGRYKIDDSSAAANIFTYKHAEECEISYLPESMLEDGAQCSAELGLYVTEVVSRSGVLPPLYIEHSWNIRGWKGKSLEGEYNVEYSVNEQRISPSNLDLESLDLRNPEDTRRLITDIRNNAQSLSVDDIDTIYKLIDMISQNGV